MVLRLNALFIKTFYLKIPDLIATTKLLGGGMADTPAFGTSYALETTIDLVFS